MLMGKGYFVISLDFELMWGVKERTIEQYGGNVLGARKAIPRMLELFRERGIHCTWAVVGFLFADTLVDLRSALPARHPCYAEEKLSTYSYLKDIGGGEEDDPYHYGASLIRLITSVPNQEIGSHTFSHYYTEEDGQTQTDFEDDLRAGAKAAEKFGLSLTSLVLPRNQINPAYLDTVARVGFTSYRGNQAGFMYASSKQSGESLLRRVFRLADAYVGLSGHNCFAPEEAVIREGLANIRASRFLRPYSRKLCFLEGLKLGRIKAQMRYAARHGLVFHLWWHPHNFGTNMDENLENLKILLDYYDLLHRKYGFESRAMRELAGEVLKK